MTLGQRERRLVVGRMPGMQYIISYKRFSAENPGESHITTAKSDRYLWPMSCVTLNRHDCLSYVKNGLVQNYLAYGRVQGNTGKERHSGPDAVVFVKLRVPTLMNMERCMASMDYPAHLQRRSSRKKGTAENTFQRNRIAVENMYIRT